MAATRLAADGNARNSVNGGGTQLAPLPHTLAPAACSIKQLAKLIGEYAATATKEQTLADLNGRKVAIDASMAIYQFLVRSPPCRAPLLLMSALPPARRASGCCCCCCP